MEWLVDTNLLVRFSDPNSSEHLKAAKSLNTLLMRGELLHVTAQNMIEFWAVATRPNSANGLGWSCPDTDKWIENFTTRFLFLDDSSAVFSEWRDRVRRFNIPGKKAHDARLVAVMKVYQLSHLLTFNVGDFSAFTDIHVIHPDAVLSGAL